MRQTNFVEREAKFLVMLAAKSAKYLDVFPLSAITSVLVIPLILFIRKPAPLANH